MPDTVNTRRRLILGSTLASLSLTDLGFSALAHAQSAPDAPAAKRSAGVESLGTIHQIDAGVLNVGYADLGPKNGPVVFLLHGWPYDIYSYADVAPLLVKAGYRVIVPYLRGYGSTTFRSADPGRIQAVRGMERGDLRRRLSEIAAAVQCGLDLPEADCPPRAAREQAPELSVLGQFLFAAMGSICREAELAPNLVGTPGDLREWIVYRMGRGRGKSGDPPQLARGWRAEFVGRLFEELLAGKLAIRVANPKSDHPLAFENQRGIVVLSPQA
jgi:hypothetical protein